MRGADRESRRGVLKQAGAHQAMRSPLQGLTCVCLPHALPVCPRHHPVTAYPDAAAAATAVAVVAAPRRWCCASSRWS